MSVQRWALSAIVLVLSVSAAASPQDAAAPAPRHDDAGASASPADYVIGPDDQLSIIFFQNKDMSGDVVVRPDGKISLPLLNDIQASGLTPDALRGRIEAEARRFMQNPNPTVLVRQINSRKVSILGWVEKPGSYPLVTRTTVLELIAAAGGLKQYAAGSRIVIMRTIDGRQTSTKFNYAQVVAQRNVSQNIELKPGDIVIVP
jgi:polysaccharide biosynthesis/export protein